MRDRCWRQGRPWRSSPSTPTTSPILPQWELWPSRLGGGRPPPLCAAIRLASDCSAESPSPEKVRFCTRPQCPSSHGEKLAAYTYRGHPPWPPGSLGGRSAPSDTQHNDAIRASAISPQAKACPSLCSGGSPWAPLGPGIPRVMALLAGFCVLRPVAVASS